jgi:hypothetical protein
VRVFQIKSALISAAETLVDKAMSMDHVGGVFGGNYKPSDFLCLVLKMLQIQPEKEIVVEFIKNEDFKYAFPEINAISCAQIRPCTWSAVYASGWDVNRLL